jgi:hypothetical protein
MAVDLLCGMEQLHTFAAQFSVEKE